jgi:hypothetical protein
MRTSRAHLTTEPHSCVCSGNASGRSARKEVKTALFVFHALAFEGYRNKLVHVDYMTHGVPVGLRMFYA